MTGSASGAVPGSALGVNVPPGEGCGSKARGGAAVAAVPCSWTPDHRQESPPTNTPSPRTLASATTRAASSAWRPAGRNPPSSETDCGVRPTCPITAMPAPTTARMVSTLAGAPPGEGRAAGWGGGIGARARWGCRRHAVPRCALHQHHIHPSAG